MLLTIISTPNQTPCFPARRPFHFTVALQGWKFLLLTITSEPTFINLAWDSRSWSEYTKNRSSLVGMANNKLHISSESSARKADAHCSVRSSISILSTDTGRARLPDLLLERELTGGGRLAGLYLLFSSPCHRLPFSTLCSLRLDNSLVREATPRVHLAFATVSRSRRYFLVAAVFFGLCGLLCMIALVMLWCVVIFSHVQFYKSENARYEPG